MSAAAADDRRLKPTPLYERKLAKFRQSRIKAPVEVSEPERTRLLALADNGCTGCRGLGLWHGRRRRPRLCHCVARAMFRRCRNKYHYIHMNQGSFTGWGRRREEFCADFYLVARRTLDGFRWRIFVLHTLEGRDWRECTRALDIERGKFFSAVYTIEAQLGRVFQRLKPYALYPLDEYFCAYGIRNEGGPNEAEVY
jgi:hypothetical protein